jgi:hypothetical protein
MMVTCYYDAENLGWLGDEFVIGYGIRVEVSYNLDQNIIAIVVAYCADLNILTHCASLGYAELDEEACEVRIRLNSRSSVNFYLRNCNNMRAMSLLVRMTFCLWLRSDWRWIGF